MSWLAALGYAAGAVVVYWLALSLINLTASYRKGAAIAAAALWPALAIVIAAFLMLDAGEWLWRQTRRQWVKVRGA